MLDQYISTRFQGKSVRFFHAENLRNFGSYCDAHALLCREELMSRDPLAFTQFRSDADDARLGALGRVFGNIYDFGAIFARAQKTTPNLYGPITLIFRPECFAHMTDIVITPKSIFVLQDQWRQQAISTPGEVDALLLGDGRNSPVSRTWYSCELSCSNRALPFHYLERIVVEPILVSGIRLLDAVVEKANAAGLTCPVEERNFRAVPNQEALRALVATCEALPRGISQANWSSVDLRLPTAFADHPQEYLSRVYGWCEYFYFGTLNELRLDDEDYDDRTVCELCDPGEDRPPALVNYRPLEEGGEAEPRVDIGRCDWCNGIAVRCRSCGSVTSPYESQYRQTLECDGGCGLRFIVQSDYDPRDGGGCEYVEIVSEAE